MIDNNLSAHGAQNRLYELEAEVKIECLEPIVELLELFKGRGRVSQFFMNNFIWSNNGVECPRSINGLVSTDQWHWVD